MRPFRLLHVMIIGGSVFVILVAGTWLVNSWRDDAGKDRKDQQAKAPDKGVVVKDNGNGKEPEKPREDPAILEVKRAQTKVRLQAILDLKDEIEVHLTALEHEVIAWETRIPGLMRSADGKKIAVNSARVEQFAGLIEKDRVSKARVKQLRTQLDTLSGPVKRANSEANRTDFPSDTILTDIEKIDREVGTKLREIREIKVEMDTILADSASAPPGEKTLENALSELEAAKARKRSETIAKARNDEHDIGSKRLAAAEAKAAKDLTDSRLKLVEARSEAEKLGIDFQIEDAKRKTDEAKAAEQKRIAKAKREAKFDVEYLKMKAYLLPITSPGFKQFDGDGGPRLGMGTTKGPMSLAALTGALRKSTSDTGNLARAISNYSDRPQGAFPHYSTGGAGVTPQNFEIWYRIQDFIAEFGDIMLERKLLAP